MRGRVALWLGLTALAAAASCQREPAALRPAAPSPVARAEVPRGAEVYVADWANHRVVRFADMSGAAWATCGETGRVELRFPVGVCLDGGGRIYVAEQQSRLHRLDDLSGAGWTTYDIGDEAGRPANRMLGCWVCVDRSGRIYMSDGALHRVIRIDDMSGANRAVLGTEGGGARQFRHPAGVWVDERNRLYVADFGNFRIVRCDDMQGTNWVELGRYGSGEREFINPSGICLDQFGRILVADQGNDRLVRVDDMQGTNWTAIGSFGVDDSPRRLYAPTGVAVDQAGRIYVTQCSSNHRVVRMDDLNGVNWTVFGGGGTGAGQFASPMGIFVR